MNPEAKKAAPDDNMPETVPATNTDTVDEATADDEYPMSLHDRVVIGLNLVVAPGLYILPGTVLRVPGS